MTDEEYQQQQLEQQEQNLELWNSVCMTDPSHTKAVNFGRKITAIDPYRQIQNATAQFGAAGVGWGWSVSNIQHLPTNEVCVLIRLWHGDDDRFIEQWGQASLYIDKDEKKKDTDCMKKATTDGITKCLSCLGFNADVFLGKFDDNKYVNDAKKHFQPLFTQDQLEAFNALILNKNEGDNYSLFCMSESMGQEAFGALVATIQADEGKRNKTKKHDAVWKLIDDVKSPLAEYIVLIEDFTADSRDDAIAELVAELVNEADQSKKYIWARLSDQAKEAFKRNTPEEKAA